MATGIGFCRLGSLAAGPIWWRYGYYQLGRRGFKGFTKSRRQQEELFPPRLILPDHGYVPTLSPPQVTSLLTVNEASVHRKSQGKDSVAAFDSNMLASNYPIEDRRAIAKVLETDGTLFGVFDGHGGAACAQAISERLFEYLAILLLPTDRLEQFSHAMKTDTPMDIIRKYQFHNDYVSQEMSSLHRTSLQRFVNETLSLSGLDDDETYSIRNGLKSAFVRLDNDISSEAMPSSGIVNFDSLEVALSGACACVAYISESDLYIANAGDARAVLGYIDDEGRLVAKTLSNDQNSENVKEVQRIRSAHPPSEASFVLKNNRLLAQLIPLRAFGDIRYKWQVKDLRSLSSMLDMVYAQNLVPMNYYTPPYLIAKPEVVQHQLSPQDRFLIIASDGLWDMLSNDQVVKLVGEHMEGRQTKDKFKIEKSSSQSLASINSELVKRKVGLAHKSLDSNAATHLMRHALGHEHRKVSEMLTFPPAVSRYYRDDITVTVVYFDEEYLAKSG